MIPLPSSLTTEEAETILRPLPEYHVFTENKKPWWTAQEVAEGLGIGTAIVRGWCENQDIVGAVKYPGPAGWRMPRSTLLPFLAQRHIDMGEGKKQA